MGGYVCVKDKGYRWDEVVGYFVEREFDVGSRVFGVEG